MLHARCSMVRRIMRGEARRTQVWVASHWLRKSGRRSCAQAEVVQGMANGCWGEEKEEAGEEESVFPFSILPLLTPVLLSEALDRSLPGDWWAVHVWASVNPTRQPGHPHLPTSAPYIRRSALLPLLRLCSLRQNDDDDHDDDHDRTTSHEETRSTNSDEQEHESGTSGKVDGRGRADERLSSASARLCLFSSREGQGGVSATSVTRPDDRQRGAAFPLHPTSTRHVTISDEHLHDPLFDDELFDARKTPARWV